LFVEGSKELSVILSEYEMIQTKNKGMADGILLGMLNNFRMTKREAKEVFNIGSGRWARIAKGLPAKVSCDSRLHDFNEITNNCLQFRSASDTMDNS
jgi:hypothetical protein